jgi:hypothetical protein
VKAPKAVQASSQIRADAEARLLRPVPEPFKMCPDLASTGREPVADTLCVLDQTGHPKLAQPLREHARGHPRDLGRKLAVRQGSVAQFPYQAHSPATAQHVEQLIARVP